jgi:hypothetical protein
MLTSGAFDPENILLGFDSLVLSGPDIPSEFSEAMTQRLELARNDSRQVVDVYPSACGKVQAGVLLLNYSRSLAITGNRLCVSQPKV